MAKTTIARHLCRRDSTSADLVDDGRVVRDFTNSLCSIASPANTTGMKIRIQTSSMFKALVESLDASSSAIPWAKLPTALRQKVVDDQENGLVTVLAAGPYQHRK